LPTVPAYSPALRRGPARRNIPSGRLGRAEDIAAAVRFFCLPETEFTTGQSLLVDGGHSLYLHE
jgi:NAD(P)-dependent dehydrogenase (short-subunit alcohol dehydrogenase family)